MARVKTTELRLPCVGSVGVGCHSNLLLSVLGTTRKTNFRSQTGLTPGKGNDTDHLDVMGLAQSKTVVLLGHLVSGVCSHHSDTKPKELPETGCPGVEDRH